MTSDAIRQYLQFLAANPLPGVIGGYDTRKNDIDTKLTPTFVAQLREKYIDKSMVAESRCVDLIYASSYALQRCVNGHNDDQPMIVSYPLEEAVKETNSEALKQCLNDPSLFAVRVGTNLPLGMLGGADKTVIHSITVFQRSILDS